MNITCKLCGKELRSSRLLVAHVRHIHKLSSKEYYDKFLKRNGEGLCKICNKETSYFDISNGYKKYCSIRCVQIDPDIIEKKKLTSVKNYGVDHPSKILKNKEMQKTRITKKNNDQEFKKMVIEKLKNRIISEDTKLKMSISAKKRCNNSLSYIKSKEFRNKQSALMKNGLAVYANSFVKNPSWPQIKTYNNVRTLYQEAVLNYQFKRYSLDIAIPSIKLDIEYDGFRYHENREKDNTRDNFLRSHGWRVLRYRDHIPKTEQLKNDIIYMTVKNYG